MDTITVRTTSREGLYDITRQVQEFIRNNRFQDGICHVYVPHTTAGVTINENADPDVRHDLLLSLRDIVNEMPQFRHAEGNSSAHVKTTLTGSSVAVLVEGGRLVLGTWQSIFFCEFDGPRTRKTHFKFMGR